VGDIEYALCPAPGNSCQAARGNAWRSRACSDGFATTSSVEVDHEHGTVPCAGAGHLVERRGEVIPRDHRLPGQPIDGGRVETLPEPLPRRAAQQEPDNQPQQSAHHARRNA
jgi:hypothetical protein